MKFNSKIFGFIYLFSLILVFSLIGCQKKSQENEVVETQIKNEVSKPESVLQDKELDTSEYKKLIKQIEIKEKEVTKLKNKRNELLYEYLEQSVEVKEVTKKLEDTQNELSRLKSSADKELIKSGRKPKYFTF